MKKIIYILLGLLTLFNYSCKKDYLDVKALSNVDDDFVFSTPGEATKVLAGCYVILQASGGFYYDIESAGSDAECHPEGYDGQARYIPEGLYATEITVNYPTSVTAWNNYYKLANRANLIIDAIGAKPEFQSAKSSGTANVWTQLYGEAVTMRAYCYNELCRWFGDVPHFSTPIRTLEQVNGALCVSRDSIYDLEIQALRDIEPLMYRLGEGGITAERINRNFVEGFIAKMALLEGGYSLRRTDFNYGSVTFDQMGIVQWNAKYVRRTDYLKYYQIAKTYLEACEANPGTATLITTDARGAGFNNPFQRNFQYNMDLVVSPESLFEIGFAQAAPGNDERPYSFGRPSNGGGGPAYPCKAYGQARMYASFYYGDYDPADLRRDVTVAVTANSGSCSEVMIDFKPGSKSSGGLSLNKWDESRMANPYTLAQRQSGINWTIMRMPDIILFLAEVDAELGDEASAKIELTKVRSRAFIAADQATKVTAYISALSGDALKEAIQQERKLEFAGEGFRRYDLIRTGKLPAKIKQIRDQQIAMVNGLTTNGYYTFPNGNTISNYIYVKAVNVSSFGMTKMLTKQCDVADTAASYPVKYPSWRGNCDLWASLNPLYIPSNGTRNLAIKGLFRYIDPNGAEAAALVAAGYVKTAWGQVIVANAAQYTTNVFKGYTDAFYAAGVPPRYLFPMSSTTIAQSNGLITNGYGFAQN